LFLDTEPAATKSEVECQPLALFTGAIRKALSLSLTLDSLSDVSLDACLLLNITRPTPDMPIMTQRVFSYWTGNDHTVHNDFINEWREEFPHFQIFGDAEVRPLIERYFPDRVKLYHKINIPTAKSDIALLLLLYEFGGLYIDCHCGIRDADKVRMLLSSLDKYDAIFVDRILSQEPRPPDQHLVINSIILSRPHFDLILRMCRQAFVNFARQHDKEVREGFVSYDIWSLSGPGLVTAMLLEPASFNCDVRWDYEGRIKIVREEIAPIVRNRYRGYGIPGQHWSERQKVELLFGSVRQHPHDLPPEELKRALAAAERPDLLRQLVDTSRRAFGVHTRHYPYTIIYPWAVSRLEGLAAGSHILDFGAGVNPLPLYLAEKGMFVDCVDNSDFVRTLPAGEDWNDWGFFDYGTLHQNLAAYNCSVAEFKPLCIYDAIYSVCAIAHFPSPVREQTLRNCWAWLKPGGRLILAVDLIASTDNIWNLGGSEETPDQHGTYHDMEHQLQSLGFVITESRIQREVEGWCRTDLYFLVAQK
jgi:SAM-dependent methyltransferase